jgi:hypothetical protein
MSLCAKPEKHYHHIHALHMHAWLHDDTLPRSQTLHDVVTYSRFLNTTENVVR